MRVLVLAFVVLAEVAMARPTPQGLPLVGDLLGHAPAPHGFLPPGGNHGIVGNLVDSLLGHNALNLDLCLNLKLGDGPQSFAPSCPNYIPPPPPPFPYPGYLSRREHKRGLLDNLLPGLTAPLGGGPSGTPLRPNKGLVINLLEALLGPNVLDLDLCLDLNLGGGPQSYAPRCPNYVPVPVGIPPPFGPVGPPPSPPIGPPGPIGPLPPASYSVAPFYRRDVEKRDLAILGGPGSYGAPILPPPPMPLPPPPAPYIEGPPIMPPPPAPYIEGPPIMPPPPAPYIEGPPILPPLLPAPLPPMPMPSAPYMGAPPPPPLPPIVSPIDEDCETPPPPPLHGLAPYHEAQPLVPPPMPVPTGPAYEVLPPIVGPSPLPLNSIPLPPPVVPLPPVYESGPPPPVPFVPVVPEYNGVPPPLPPSPMLPPPPPFMPVGPPPPPPMPVGPPPPPLMPIGPPPPAPAPIGPPPPPMTSIANDVVLAYTNTANGNMPAICIPVPYPVATGPGAALPPPPPLGGPVYNAIMPPLM